MKRPLIGITADLENGKFLLKSNYVAMIEEAGASPVILPALAEPGNLDLDRYDALVLSGGDDLDTAVLGLPLHPQARPMDPRRQQAELALLKTLEAFPQMPVLGICLGMQLMGVHAGARLLQHLPDVLATAETHLGDRVHLVTGELGEGEVVSHHHQALADPGSLRVVARSPDGVIEAVVDDRRAFYLGVQWHPERTPDRSLGLGVFQRVVKAAQGR